MDIAYDHIQEETLSPEAAGDGENKNAKEQPSLNTEFAQAYKAISSSPWGARLGAFVGTVKKQGESYYDGAKQEYTAASTQASKGLSDLVNRTRALSLTKSINTDTISQAEDVRGDQREPGESQAPSDDRTKTRTESVLSRFRSEAFKRLKDLEKAEDAADEALLKFGTNLRNFLREAVQIAPPSDADPSGSKVDKREILYESKDQEGKRVIHTTRFEAQLHVIHTRTESFLQDSSSPEYSRWKESFDVDNKTDQIAVDLDKYRDLRSTMELLVPDQVNYQDFWMRYYFLRQVIEEEEARRKDIMKGVSAAPEEDVAWDEDSDTETTAADPGTADKEKDVAVSVAVNDTSTATLHPPLAPRISASTKMPADSAAVSASSAKAVDPRSSNDQHSLPDSDTSYDVVSGAPSGAPSHAPGSPRPEVGIEKDMAKGIEVTSPPKILHESNGSDEEDWE